LTVLHEGVTLRYVLKWDEKNLQCDRATTNFSCSKMTGRQPAMGTRNKGRKSHWIIRDMCQSWELNRHRALTNKVSLNVNTTIISGFRRDVDEICALLGCYAASNGNPLPTFRDNVSVPSSRVKKSKKKECYFLVGLLDA
jgi:hypothetical protein